MALGTDPGCSLDLQVVLIKQAQQMVRLSLGIRWSIGAHEPRHRFAVVNGRLVDEQSCGLKRGFGPAGKVATARAENDAMDETLAPT